MSEQNWLRELFQRSEQESQRIDDIFYALEATGRLKSVIVAEWYCQKKSCLMGFAFRLPDDLVVRTMPYEMSAAETESSSVESARRKRMNDQGYWDPQTYRIDPGWPEAFAQFRCHHATANVSFKELLELVADVDPGKPIHIVT